MKTPTQPSMPARIGMILAACLACLGFDGAAAAVVSYSLPLPFRTSVEYINAPPALYSYSDPNYMVYPIDFNGDGQAEFIISHNNQSGGTMRLYSAQTANQVITTLVAEEIFNIQVNPYPIPGPPGIEVGPNPPGTGIKWGNFYPAPEADILGLGPMAGYYALAGSLGGDTGYYSRAWNRRLPADWDYLAVRFQLDDGLHYGYLRFAYEPRLNGAVGGIYGVLRGWEWESEPGVPITVVPEPSSVGLLAAAGLLLMSRRARGGRVGSNTRFSQL